MARIKESTVASDPVTDGPDSVPEAAPTAPVPATAAEKPTATPPTPQIAPAPAVVRSDPSAAEVAELKARIAEWESRNGPAPVGAATTPIAGHVRRRFKVSIPHNPPLVVEVDGPADSLDWGSRAIKEFNRARGILSTVHVHTVENADGEPTPVGPA